MDDADVKLGFCQAGAAPCIGDAGAAVVGCLARFGGGVGLLEVSGGLLALLLPVPGVQWFAGAGLGLWAEKGPGLRAGPLTPGGGCGALSGLLTLCGPCWVRCWAWRCPSGFSAGPGPGWGRSGQRAGSLLPLVLGGVPWFAGSALGSRGQLAGSGLVSLEAGRGEGSAVC